MEHTSGGWQVKGVQLKHGALLAVNGNTIDTAYHSWKCNGIELQDGHTVLTKTVYPKSNTSYMYSSQEEYIEDADTGRKYYLITSSLGFEGSPQYSYSTDPVTFYEVYPALPASVKKINISSGSEYYVKGLKIK